MSLQPTSHLREIARRIISRHVLAPRHRTWAFDGFNEATPSLAAWSAGVALGTWSTDPDLPDWASSLTYHLTTHTMSTVASHRYVVTASLDRDHAAVSVMALRGRITAQFAPAACPAVQRFSQKAGHIPLPAGPLAYAVITLPTPGPLPQPPSEPG
ncbi:hypothetical protein [Streptomyces sampsonii]|uniref:hypothetical protein n=1 Tax=Streptomyces sampsonii TaxID=42239 RepID=UPI0008F4E60A|nr:hypothetical protein [Streptomyces sampsonii]